MVDISSNDNKINLSVSSAGNSGKLEVNILPSGSSNRLDVDTSQNYYDGMARQWAISENLVNGEDYSSKHYAQKSKDQALIATENAEIATSKAQEVVDSTNEALSKITAQEAVSKSAVTTEGDTQVARVQAEGANYATKAEATYTAGQGISIENNVISNTQTSAEWGNIEGDIKDQTDLTGYVESKFGSLNNPYSLFDCKFADHILDNISWLRSEGQWNKKAVQESGYNKLLAEYNASTDIVERQNFTVAGAPTFNGKVVSGFSTANYLTLPEAFPANTTSWELNLKFTTGSVINDDAHVIFDTQNTVDNRAISVYTSRVLTMAYCLSSVNTGTMNIANNVAGATTITPNTLYYLRGIFDGTSYKFYLSTTGEFAGEEVLDCSIESTASIYSGQMGFGKFFKGNGAIFNGSIDLSGCSLKVNGEMWWNPYIETYRITPKKYRIYDVSQQDWVDNQYNTTGVAWYYGIDPINEKFRLPRTKYGFKGVRNSVGGYIQDSLPNIKGYWNSVDNGGATYPSGKNAVYQYYSGGNHLNGGNYTTNKTYALDASRSSSAYKDGASVQERGTEMYLYFYIGETVQNPNLINAGEIGEQIVDLKAEKYSKSDYVRYETNWFDIATSGYYTFDLTGQEILKVSESRRKIALLGKVKTAQNGYSVGDIVYPEFANITGSSDYELGWGICISGTTLKARTGNAGEFVSVSPNGSTPSSYLIKANVQVKLIIEGWKE